MRKQQVVKEESRFILPRQELQDISANTMLRLMREKRSAYWTETSRKATLQLFRAAAKRVPAYKHFLKKNNISSEKVETWKDFHLTVPLVSKSNYLRQYPLEELCWDGKLKPSTVFTSTSGSTGEPFYFPRNEIVDSQSSLYHELFLEHARVRSDQSVLVVVCFGMGVWIGGVITYEAFSRVGERGRPVTVITPGVNKKEIYDAVKHLGDKFDVVVLCGYPPFIKDLIDEGKVHGINWRAYDLRLIFAAETFSEKFREHVTGKVGIQNGMRETMNIYGSADIGTMAVETPLTILLRRIAIQDEKIFKGLFGDAGQLPTVVQFNPLFINFEAEKRTILLSANSILPLLRYAIGDCGGVLPYSEVETILRHNEVSLDKQIAKANIKDSALELPFLYVYERSDLSTKLYGAIIYPEYIRAALERPALERFLTGRFTMLTKFTSRHNEYLEVNIELRRGVSKLNSLLKLVTEHLVESLTEKSAEYKYLSSIIYDRVLPLVVFWSHEHPLHFKVGGKQKWVKKV